MNPVTVVLLSVALVGRYHHTHVLHICSFCCKMTKEKQTSFVGFYADEADYSWGLWNMETDIRCFCTGPVDVLTQVILAGIMAYHVLV